MRRWGLCLSVRIWISKLRNLKNRWVKRCIGTLVRGTYSTLPRSRKWRNRKYTDRSSRWQAHLKLLSERRLMSFLISLPSHQILLEKMIAQIWGQKTPKLWALFTANRSPDLSRKRKLSRELIKNIIANKFQNLISLSNSHLNQRSRKGRTSSFRSWKRQFKKNTKTDLSIDLNLRFLRLIIVHKEVLLEVHTKKQRLLLQIENDKVHKASLGSKILTVKIRCKISFCENKWTSSKTNQSSKEIQTTEQLSTTQWRRSMTTSKIWKSRRDSSKETTSTIGF